MGQAEFEALAERYGLRADQREATLRLLELLQHDPLAPTRIRDPDGVLRDHLADTLVALEIAEVRGAGTLADLGSGPGVPGLPLAIALPQAHVFLIESSQRKCDFLVRASSWCGTTNVSVVHARAETWEGQAGFLDVVTARALAEPAVVAEYASPLLRLGGVLVMWRGRRDPEAEGRAERAAAALGLECSTPQPVAPYPGAHHRHLQLMRKLQPTPEGFPRRPGVAIKRPLGG